ncbi:phosphonate ABC transporter ATP-binding protein [Arthrobacter castelli]|uniref:phosphonate ABC transporter ATP-binding protein n=1 Tax=Arthrobacter castelli TaxID=271431 RepID=UPI0004124CC2|nr:ATP-binding cassette domain-containing protein [Arthrobacter castelli]
MNMTMTAPEVSTTALSVRGLVKSYGGRPVLTGVDFDVRYGEIVALLGANGSGKSTALQCIMGLADPDDGGIRLGGADLGPLRGRELAAARQQAAMVFQKVHLVPRLSAVDNVCAGALHRMPGWRSMLPQLYPRQIREEAMACLDRTGMAGRALEQVGRLSGGQQQRVAIARSLCQRATVVLADEPVSALDPHAAEQVMSLLADLAHTEHLAVATVLHQPDLARRYADRAVGLLEGQVDFDVAPADLTGEHLEPLYLPDRVAA